MEKKLYTLLVYTENRAGILSQITSVFTRCQINIESINVSAYDLLGVHKHLITAWSDEEQIKKTVKLIEKKVDVIKASYNTDDQLFVQESALYKIATPILLDNPEVSRTIRRLNAYMMEVNPTYSIVQYAGKSEDLMELSDRLTAFGCLLQYSRSGRIAVTRSKEEPITAYLNELKEANEGSNAQ